MNLLLALTMTLVTGASPVEPVTTKALYQRTLAAQAGTLAERSALKDTAARAVRTQPGGDSLKNGAIVGAVLGGAALGGFIGYLCSVFATEGQDCFGGTLVWAIVGAAGGAAIGAGVDALFDSPLFRRDTQPRQTGSVPFRMALRISF